MAVTIVDPPRVRAAGSLDLFTEDLDQLRAFRCFVGAGAWYEREAVKVLRQAIRLYQAGTLRARDRILLYERDGELMAVCAFGEESRQTVHLGFVGIGYELHGARIDSDDGDRLSDAVVATALEEATDLGYTRATAQVARDHVRSRVMLMRAGFEQLSRFDHDYDIFAVALR